MTDLHLLNTRHATGPQGLRRLGKNVNGYSGETIPIPAVLRECVEAARSRGWTVEDIHSGPAWNLLAFTRHSFSWQKPTAFADTRPPVGEEPIRIYISTGIHGDEPAGPLAVFQLLQENEWPEGTDLWLCPCLNPSGFLTNRRENPDGLDLNREYLRPKAAETLAHIRWLENQPRFDVCFCLHEDWESHGFYVYELNPDNHPSLAEEIIAKVAQVCPIDLSDVIESRPAKNGIIRPSIDVRTRPQWPEAFYLLTHKTRLSYTLEAPSDFPLSCRVASLVAGVKGALASYAGAREPSNQTSGS